MHFMASAPPACCRESGVRVTEFSTWGVETCLRLYLLPSAFMSLTYGHFCKVVNSSEMVRDTSEVDFKAVDGNQAFFSIGHRCQQ